MIYIEEATVDIFFGVCSVMSADLKGEAVLWIRPPVDDVHPDEFKSYRSFIGYQLFLSSEFEEEQPTDYFGTVPERTNRIAISDDLISRVVDNFHTVEEVCDSVAFYQGCECRWVVCMYFNENMILLREDSLFSKVRSIAPNASLVAPKWW